MMKEKKKAGFRFNALDVVLILLVILCIVGVWQRENIQNLFASGDNLDTYTVTFEVRRVRQNVVDCLDAEQSLYIEDDGVRVSLGKLTAKPVDQPAAAYMPDENGNIVEAVYPEDAYEYLKDITGTLSCRGFEQDGSFYLEGKTDLTVNEVLKAYTENAEFELRITSITKNP